MARQITIELDDDEYAALEQKATALGMTVAEMARRKIALEHMRASRKQPIDPLAEQMYLEGFIENIPTGEPDTPEIAALRQKLYDSLGPGKPLSEMVIEDRGVR